MKTATITFHAPNNNGSFFQSYALQQIIKNKFHVDNTIIDYRTERQRSLYSLFRPVKSKRDLAKNIVSICHFNSLRTHNKRFEDMRHNYLKMSERCSTINEVNKMMKNYELVIAGSDQIWNTKAPDFSEAYFLPEIDSKKITYAVSFGSGYKDNLLSNYTDFINKFDKISVREEQSKNYLEMLVGKAIDVVVDPTLLLDKEDYLKFSDSKPLVDGDYIFFYSMSYQPEVLQIVKQVANQLGCRVITVFTTFSSVRCKKYGIKLIYDAGPAEFINLLMYSKIVLTNSFHGVAFSIIFRKLFYNVCTTNNHILYKDDRIDGILNYLQVPGRCIGVNDLPIKLEEINWENVDENLIKARKKSFDFLSDALFEQ
ncbi:polysaccharide pyruvyl transferase family protein [Eubacterium sp.]|uniref:polysaccharide pyruvyl transferase family protein n=1 Tax=Eubacterium sp. TaxID=142586 RepID=UPI00258A0E60|nr:polysaccharide pyruvyl transferase family protein [Eubacterium sp.]MCR5368466.1 polysaccharide pyruvyl transferase family protein [Eubacterium sp.]